MKFKHLFVGLLLQSVFILPNTLFSQTLIHNFEFNTNFNDTKPTGTVLTEVNTATSSFGTSPNSWTWTQTTNPGGGLQLLTDQLTDETNYSLGFRIEFDETGSGYRKIITFKGTSSDNGLYFQNDLLKLFPSSTTSTTTYSDNTFYDFVLTRSSNNNFKVYTVSVGVVTLVYDITDTNGDAVPILNGSDREFRFFMDDAVNGHERTPGGTVRSIRMWNRPLTPDEILASLSSALTHDATSMSNTGATLNGEVNPQGTASTFSFEWGTTTAYGNTMTTPTPSSSSSSASIDISGALTGLTPNTTYHYRIKSNNGGGDVFGGDKTFTTTNNLPGGISANLNLWLRADQGTGSLSTSWQDQSGQGNDYITVTGPTVVADALNYNDGVEILNGGFDAPTGAALLNEWTLFFVSKKLASDNDGRVFDAHSGNYLWGYHGTSRNSLWINGSPGVTSNTPATTQGIEDLHAFTYVRDLSGDVLNRADGDQLSFYGISNTTSGTRIDINTGQTTVERSDSRIGEMIKYDRDLTATEINKVESYLGVKYSVSLASDYTASDNSQFWDASLTPSYQNGIIGLGKDSGNNLNQKQSHSTNDDLRVYIDALAIGNTSNAGTISNDMSFLMIGHNSAALSADYSYVNSEIPSGLSLIQRVEREWKITNMNFNETFTLDINLNTPISDVNHIRILQDTDGDFSDAILAPGVTVTLSSTGVGGVLTISGLTVADNTTSYITIATTNTSTPLPVELVDFTAELRDRVVELNWETKSEINNDYFMVERSKDGFNWETLNQVDGAGNSVVSLNYESFDNNPFVETSYYRLKQVDFDGVFKHSNIQAVNFIKGAELEVFPNPTKDILNVISVSDVDASEIRLISNLGVNLMNRNRVLFSDNKKFKIDVYDLPTGMYTLLVNGKSFSFVKE